MMRSKNPTFFGILETMSTMFASAFCFEALGIYTRRCPRAERTPGVCVSCFSVVTLKADIGGGVVVGCLGAWRGDVVDPM